ncbi:hypothetical protein RvY_03621 [Ramazzottius varieornatus]|uniref:Uncharacterized protein n=1 Tax=Ramazzottius varieornatus TaxID=947166 RepID=A0A1D1UUD9_RAMVA|nr:hypothetical protein RvY_03621 [Ramazzottius varieornatus]
MTGGECVFIAGQPFPHPFYGNFTWQNHDEDDVDYLESEEDDGCFYWNPLPKSTVSWYGRNHLPIGEPLCSYFVNLGATKCATGRETFTDLKFAEVSSAGLLASETHNSVMAWFFLPLVFFLLASSTVFVFWYYSRMVSEWWKIAQLTDTVAK